MSRKRLRMAGPSRTSSRSYGEKITHCRWPIRSDSLPAFFLSMNTTRFRCPYGISFTVTYVGPSFRLTVTPQAPISQPFRTTYRSMDVR